MGGIFLTTIGVLKKIGHQNYKFFKWNYMANVFNIFTYFWSIVRERPDNEVIEYMKDIAQFLEMDDLTWRKLMLMFHGGAAGRAHAEMLLWQLFNKAAIIEHVNIFKSTSAINCEDKDVMNVLKSDWNPEQIEMPPDDILMQTPSGVRIKSAWQVIKEHHKKNGPQGSGITDECVLKWEDRDRDLKLAFEETDSSTQQTPEDRSRASMPPQTSSSSLVAGQGSSSSMARQGSSWP